MKKHLGAGQASRPNSADISQLAPESTGSPQVIVDKPSSGGAKQKHRGGLDTQAVVTSRVAPKLKVRHRVQMCKKKTSKCPDF